MENDGVFAKDAGIGEGEHVDDKLLQHSVKETVDLSLDASKHESKDEAREEAAEAESSPAGSEDVTLSKDGNVELGDTLGNNKNDAPEEDAKIGEGKAVNDQLLESSVKETVDLILDASKQADEDEMREEVAEAESSPGGFGDVALSKDGNVGLGGTLGNDKGHSDDVSEGDKVDAVIGEPCAVSDSEESADKTLPLVSEESNEEEKISIENIVGGERNGLVEDGIAENGKGNGHEIFISAPTDGETEKLSDGNKVLDQSNQNLARGESNKLSYLEALTSKDAPILQADRKEEPTEQNQDRQELIQSSRPEADQEKHDIESIEIILVEDTNGTKRNEIHTETPKGVSSDSAALVNYEDSNRADSYSLKGDIRGTQPPFKDVDDVTESGANHPLELDSNRDTLHNIELDAMPYSELQQDQCEKMVANLQPEVKKDQEGNIQEKSYTSGAIVKVDKVEELKEHDSESVKVDNHDIDKETNIVIAAGGTSTTGHSLARSELDCNKDPTLVNSSPILDIEETKSSSGPSQSQLVNPSTDVSSTAIDGLGHEGVKNKEEICLPETTDQEGGPSTVTLSSSGNTSTSDQTETSANVEQVSKLQVPVPQDISANDVKEIQSAADSSSSANSSGPHLSGLKNTSPPVGAISESKERGSNFASNVPSTNVTASTPTRPAGLGRAAPLPEPTSHHVQHSRVNGAVSASQNQLVEESSNGEAEEYDETREKLQMIRVKFLRLAHRLGQTPHNVVVAQVLYRLGLAEQLHGRSGGRGGAFSFDRASAMAERLEAAGQEPLDFTCTIMVLGKSGVGKSATINSIFDEVMFGTDAFQFGTKKVQDVIGTVQGIRVRVIDTPGLLPSWSDQRQNEKILHSVKRFIKKTPPDIVLYLDRLDMQSRDFGDMPLLRTITEIFGPSIWFSAIVVLTHAASAPPEGPNGTATSYDMFVTQRSHVVQQAIRQAAGDMRLMNPVSLVENHSACRTNRAGQRVLPNGQVWKPHLLLLSFASKILAEANTLLKLQDNPPGRQSVPRTRSPPLPFLLSSLLQSRPEVKLPSEQFGDDDDDAIDDDLDDCSDSDEESEYDELPPFKPLTKAQLEKLTKAQRNAYYDELEYREKLFMKKQLKEEKKRRKMLKKMQEAAKDLPAGYGDNDEEETGVAASVPVPMPDLVLPASFDSDNPTHRYRSLDSSNPWLVRAVLEPNGWDHDIGYDGINVERVFVVKDKVPISFSGHISKDKKDANLQMEFASSLKHGKGKTTSMGFDMQSVGKDYAYTLRSETRFSNNRINKAAVGFSATLLGDVLTGGLKLEDKLNIGKRCQVVMSGGSIYGRGEVAYGGSVEATLKDKDHPLGRFLSTLGLSVMDWHGDLAIGFNSQTQIPIGRHTNLIGRLNVNNRGSGQLSVRVNSSEQLQIVLVSLIPLAQKLLYIFDRSIKGNGANR